jgi:hypothetical protein
LRIGKDAAEEHAAGEPRAFRRQVAVRGRLASRTRARSSVCLANLFWAGILPIRDTKKTAKADVYFLRSRAYGIT